MNFRLICLRKRIRQIQANRKDYNNHICEIDLQGYRQFKAVLRGLHKTYD
jgi:hypothetical protein